MPEVKKAFTLFELLIVVLIISVLYGLFLQNLDFRKDQESYGFKNLKEFLENFWEKGALRERLELICYDDCSVCNVFQNGEMIEEGFETQGAIRAYEFTENDILEDVMYENIEIGRDSFDVCFRYSLYPNGSGDQIVAEYQEQVYLFQPYFESTTMYETLFEAKDALSDQRRKLKE